ncbi:membrane protein insertase YidC [Candidatus Aerophobetes bacterium]|nr:membrane protein insertase YidC [Candidatus Aerophobetes bacterium]
MEKNIILAIVLSVTILIVYNIFFMPKPVVREDVPVAAPEEEVRIGVDGKPIERPLPVQGRPVTLENANIQLTVNTEGGRITSWYLKEKKTDLLKEEGKTIYFYLELPGGGIFDFSGTEFQVIEKEEDKKLVLMWEDTERNIRITETVKLPEQGYHVFFDLSVESPDYLRWYLVSPTKMGEKVSDEERVVFWEDNLYREKKEGVRPEYDARVQWLAVRGKNFVTAVVPLSRVEKGFFKIDSWGFATTGQNTRWLLYAGPQAFAYMRLANNSVKDRLGKDYRLTDALNISIWGHLSVGLQKLLIFLYSLTHNYGTAIILLTLIIFGILSPLTFKQFESMQKMQAVQPELKEVQKKFKSEPKKMQAEMMKIYAKHKINPVGGCLPMVIQLPIIFVLYRALLDFPFAENPSFLWIKNLGEPNIPLLLGLAGGMFLQQRITQKLQPTSGDQAGIAKMMQFFPLFLIIILWSLPSGVMLYWFTSTLISIAQQFFIRKKATISPS